MKKLFRKVTKRETFIKIIVFISALMLIITSLLPLVLQSFY